MEPRKRHQLERNRPKGVCPHCGRKGKWRFFDGHHGDTRFGICDRINSCPSEGNIYYPDKRTPIITRTIGVQAKKNQLFLTDKDANTMLKVANTNFHKYCHGLGITRQHLYKWNIGGNGVETAFLFQNVDKKWINVKKGRYDKYGKRNKDMGFYSMKHTNDGYYALCLYGEHLFTNRKIYIVESEKTAVIASWFYPQYDWCACGAASGLSDGSNDSNDKIKILKDKNVVWMCDADKAGRNNSSIRNMIKHNIRFRIVDLFTSREDGYDIADRIIESPEDLPKI